MLPSRVTVPAPPNPTREDIFSSALSTLFTDDTQNSHGTPGRCVIYRSPRYGDVTLEIPRHPDVEEGRKLFAHYLWNAGVVAADAIESASNDDTSEASTGKVSWNKRYWDFSNKNILEIGAGTALPSLIAALSYARSVTITDHPSSPALVADTIIHNVHHNLKINLLPKSSPSCNPADPAGKLLIPDSDQQPQPQPRTITAVQVCGLTWGDTTFTSPAHRSKPSDSQPRQVSFDKIIIADCLWMPSQHVNLVKTINAYLLTRHQNRDDGAEQESEPCALVIAGFHTGRRVVSSFFRLATGSRSGRPRNNASISIPPSQGPQREDEEQDSDEDNGEEADGLKGTLAAAEIFEVDVDCNVRPWMPERQGESKEAAKRWCVVAVLVRV